MGRAFSVESIWRKGMRLKAPLIVIAVCLNISTVTATSALPTPDQLAWTTLEVGALITWGINTELPSGTKIGNYVTKGPAMCGGCGWGLDALPQPDEFNPTEMDVDSYVQAAQNMGANYLVLSASHCSGFL